MGDDISPDEFNDLTCNTFSPPALKVQVHSAQLGIAFYTGE